MKSISEENQQHVAGSVWNTSPDCHCREKDAELLKLRALQEKYEWLIQAVDIICTEVKFWKDQALQLQQEKEENNE
jgi:hypothetical protein